MAGPYAKRLDGLAALISFFASVGAAISRPVLASVAPNRFRLSATARASTPPAIAVKRNALTTSGGPTIAPTAAMNFTSPAPVAPSAWPGSMSRRPTMNPAKDAPSEIPLTPEAAKPTPIPAMVAVSAFGMRRTLISITVATSAPEDSAANATLEIAGNRRPEHVGNRLAHHRHGADREDRDERHEQPVLEEVLTILGASEAAPGELSQCHHCDWRLHWVISSENFGECRGVHRADAPTARPCLRGAAERVGDRGEDVVHRSTRRTDRTDRDQRDQRDEQRVLEQVLTLFVAKRLHDSNKLRHVIPPGIAPPWAVRWCGAAASLLHARRTCRATGPANRNGCATAGCQPRGTPRKLFCGWRFTAEAAAWERAVCQTAAHALAATFVSAARNLVTAAKRRSHKDDRVQARICMFLRPIRTDCQPICCGTPIAIQICQPSGRAATGTSERNRADETGDSTGDRVSRRVWRGSHDARLGRRSRARSLQRSRRQRRRRSHALGRSRRRPRTRIDVRGPVSIHRKRADAHLRRRRRGAHRVHAADLAGSVTSFAESFDLAEPRCARSCPGARSAPGHDPQTRDPRSCPRGARPRRVARRRDCRRRCARPRRHFVHRAALAAR